MSRCARMQIKHSLTLVWADETEKKKARRHSSVYTDLCIRYLFFFVFVLSFTEVQTHLKRGSHTHMDVRWNKLNDAAHLGLLSARPE